MQSGNLYPQARVIHLAASALPAKSALFRQNGLITQVTFWAIHLKPRPSSLK